MSTLSTVHIWIHDLTFKTRSKTKSQDTESNTSKIVSRLLLKSGQIKLWYKLQNKLQLLYQAKSRPYAKPIIGIIIYASHMK